jgi:membrane-associated protein
MVVGEKQEPFWRRHLVALVAGGFAVLLVVIVVGQLLDQGDVAKWLADVPQQCAYVLCFLFVWFDAVIPIFPAETALERRFNDRRRGKPRPRAGHARRRARRDHRGLVAVLDRAQERREGEAPARPGAGESEGRVVWGALARSPGLLIVAGRYVPGMRFAVNASMGLSDMPYRRFLPWSVLGGGLWSVYTCALAYWVSTRLAGYPLASLVISSLITSAAVAAVYFVDRHKRRGGDAAQPAAAGAQPAIPSSTAQSER